MAGEFETSVKYGLMLSKRIYYGKECPPPPEPAMTRALSSSTKPPPAGSYLPTAVTVYAVVDQPETVDNPDVPSYQPYVHGRCEPAALIPLHMHGGVSMEVECCLDHATVAVSGAWRVHCIQAGSRCDCRIAVPTGREGSLLGVEVEVSGRSYHSQLIAAEGSNNKENVNGDGRYLKGSIYTFKIPQVDGGATLSIKVSWSQKLTYHEGQFCLNVPFKFPAVVNPVGKKISKRERILLNVNSGIGREILCKSTSHALKEVRREVGKMGFVYEAEVKNWSTRDFNFSYSVVSNDIFGGVLLQSPLLQDSDDRQMVCLYLFPGDGQSRKVFTKEVIFMIDISGSMKGEPLEAAKNALLSSLSNLSPQDSFNIIAFNGETHSYSSSMEPASQEAILKATQWLNHNLIADGGTNILLPIKQAIRLVAETTKSIPLIFLITDGSVEDEREICNFLKTSLANGGPFSPRVCTFGIGTYCNHYFLQQLAQIGRGHFDSSYDADTIDSRVQRLFATASSIILANITVDSLENIDSLELLPFAIPDLSCGKPLIISGRYTGDFPDSVKISGTLADMSNFAIELKTQKAKDVQLDRILARRQIDLLTADAWLSESKTLEQKVAKMSIRTGVPSEYTYLVLLQTGTVE
ncbi:hypothetical protein Tsubulata_042309, partial [Turnera subulata]